jgi:methionyl-tRNA formyltransferase
MRLVFLGTPEFAIPALRSLAKAGHEVLAAVTQPDRPRRRRSGPPEPSPVKREAQRLGLPILQPVSVREPQFADRLRALAPETGVVVAYGQILPPEILAIPPRGWINVHASLLPLYRGAAPIARAILAGERVTGVTTMKMDRGLDTGDVLLQRECAIGLTETAGELTSRLAVLGAELLVGTLDLHARGGLEPRRQDPSQATQAPPLSRSDGRIDWSSPAEEIALRVRACNPWPLAGSFLGARAMQILRAEVNLEPVSYRERRPPPGRVVVRGGRLLVRCRGDSHLSLLELRFPGGRAMSARDALNGRLIGPGDTLTAAPAA